MAHSLKNEEQNWYNKKRNKSILIQPEQHLIVCQGEKTEPNYFKGIETKINNKYKNKISIEILSDNVSCMELLETAKEKVKTDKRKQIKYKHVWLVYDKDDFPSDEFDNILPKIDAVNEKNKENDEPEYHVLWSNQCIEFWFLIHFIDLRVNIDRKAYIDKLSENFKKYKIKGKYIKNDSQIYKKLEKYQDDAIRRAEKIIKENKEKTPSNITPGTKVYEIIKYLKAYL